MFNIKTQSWTNGGTSHILDGERSKATFDIDKMTNILDGGAEFTTKRRWIQSAHDVVFDDNGQEERVGQVEVHADMSRSKVVAQSMKHFMDVHWEHLERGYRPKDQDMTFMSGAKFGNTGPLSLHYGVFMSTMRSQTSAEQRDWWVEPGMKLNYIGCYAQTELGHGSNVRGLQTTATFQPGARNGDGEWIMSTPTLQSTKWWSTGLYSATHAAVYAQMILNGKPRGVHVFFVQLRGEDLKPLPGIDMGDIGPKVREINIYVVDVVVLLVVVVVVVLSLSLLSCADMNTLCLSFSVLFFFSFLLLCNQLGDNDTVRGFFSSFICFVHCTLLLTYRYIFFVLIYSPLDI